MQLHCGMPLNDGAPAAFLGASQGRVCLHTQLYLGLHVSERLESYFVNVDFC